MSEHYYTSQPQVRTDEREIQAELRGHHFRFVTDRGVFSKKGIDFGTRLLIETVELNREKTLLDFGCGYGSIGTVFAKLYPNLLVTMLDINERAIHLARKNAELNHVIDRVKFVVSDGLVEIKDQTFDTILLNPPIRIGKSAVYSLFEQAREHLNPNGSFWIVIRKQQGASSAKQKLTQLFDQVEVVKQKKGYWVIRAFY
jgi:16S rRNA (guanine1207-N2)-methyltransferase